MKSDPAAVEQALSRAGRKFLKNPVVRVDRRTGGIDVLDGDHRVSSIMVARIAYEAGRETFRRKLRELDGNHGVAS